MNLELLLTPEPLPQFDTQNKTVVVIDVLRSSTSICAALQSGAKGIIPVAGAGQAGEMRNKLGADVAVLAGEKGGMRIENFELGNSPAEFTAAAVEKKLVVLATTNGTAPFALAEQAEALIACGFVNISAVTDRVVVLSRDLIVVCAGREGSFSLEDTLCGGMLIHQLQTDHGLTIIGNDAAKLATLLFEDYRENLAERVRDSQHGKYLSSIGFDSDIEFAMNIDTIPIVPFLKDGRLVIQEGAAADKFA